jgi:hypothetical protein
LLRPIGLFKRDASSLRQALSKVVPLVYIILELSLLFNIQRILSLVISWVFREHILLQTWSQIKLRDGWFAVIIVWYGFRFFFGF